VQNQQEEKKSTAPIAAAGNAWTKVKGKSKERQSKPRSDAIIIEPKGKMTYAEILNLVTRNQSEKLKSVGESVRRVKCTAKGALLLELNRSTPETTQQIRDSIGSVLEGKVEARALTPQTRLEIVDLDEMATAKDCKMLSASKLAFRSKRTPSKACDQLLEVHSAR